MTDTREDQILETAAEWWQRVRAGEGQGVQAWLDADPIHADAFARVEAGWAQFDALATEPELLAMRSDALARARRVGAQRWSTPVDRRVFAGGLAAGVAAAGVGVWWWLAGRGRTLQTETGEQRTVALDDQSRVFLDANTHVVVAYTPETRHISLLAGRAHFEVAKDPSRPFKVTAGGHDVIALGTAFSVEKRDEVVRVTLVEGRVSVVGKGEAARELSPQQELLFSQGQPTRFSDRVDTVRALDWREGKLVFDNDSLGDAVSRMNDYSRLKVRIADDRARGLRISGTFTAGQTAAFIDAVKSYYPVEVDQAGDTALIRSKL